METRLAGLTSLSATPLDPPATSPTSPAASRDLRALVNAVRHGLLSFDRRLVVDHHNERLGHVLGVALGVLANCASVMQVLEASPLLDEAGVQRIHEACLAAVAGTDPVDPGDGATLVLTAAASARTLAVEVCRIDAARWLVSFEDITARRATQARAMAEALTDPLTGLANRKLFFDRIDAALDAEPPTDAPRPDRRDDAAAGPAPVALAVLMIDLDRFKAVNDTLGHGIGDALLRLVAQRLQSMLRDGDVVARLGGDEFGVLLPAHKMVGDKAVDLAKLGRRIVDVVGRPYLIDGHLVNVGASVGIARAPRDGRVRADLLRHADLALYQVKASGRNAFSFFDPAMDARAEARRTLETDLRRALTLREFELYYQPQVDVETRRVTGFEALIRWRHPQRGLVSPGDFIWLAEEIGLIVPIGEWVLREACREATTWPDAVSVAVNVSPHQFEDLRLPDLIAKVLATTGLAPQRLEIEITESVMMRNEAAALATLRRLKALGVRVAMDDFGTGYSSLSQLRAFPFDKIKIDRSFLTNGSTDDNDAIIRAINAMGASLGIATIAEGVETSAQLARIRTEGCGSVQGYLFSRPVPAAEIADLITDIGGRPAPEDHHAIDEAVA